MPRWPQAGPRPHSEELSSQLRPSRRQSSRLPQPRPRRRQSLLCRQPVMRRCRARICRLSSRRRAARAATPGRAARPAPSRAPPPFTWTTFSATPDKVCRTICNTLAILCAHPLCNKAAPCRLPIGITAQRAEASCAQFRSDKPTV